MSRVTLVYLLRRKHDQPEVLLAMKKRGFGQGWWNGVGGKIEPDETAEAAAIREAQEEIGVTPIGLRPAARLAFEFPDDRETRPTDCHVFTADRWEGEPVETEEMRPQWFAVDDLPLASMWPDDVYWLSHVLEGELLVGRFVIDGRHRIIDQRVAVVHSLPDSL